jgi:molecular chaperone GrpE
LSDQPRKHEDKRKKPEDTGVRIPVTGEDAGSEAAPEEEKEQSVLLSAEEYEALLARIEELNDLYLRAAADFENFRKRAEKERDNIICYANEKLIGDLLPILDNLDRALSADVDGTTVGSILEGIRMVSGQLHSVLNACGLEPVNALGSSFDPQVHEAVGVLPSGDHEEGTVLSELQKGYRLKGKVLRHSVVHVAGQPDGDPGGNER